MSSSSRSQKSQNTCVQCRTRKVRCDGQYGGCSNCERLQFVCSFRGNYQDYTSMYRRPKRRRVMQACIGCRDQKARCSADLPTCQRCEERGIECVYAPPSAKSKASPSGTSGPYKDPQHAVGSTVSPAHSLGAEVNLPDHQTTRKAIEDFFRHIHPLPAYAFLHQASLTVAFETGQLDPALTLAICGVSVQCRSLDIKDQDRASAWIDASEEIVLRQIERPSIVRLQALLLIIRHRLESRSYAKGFMLVSLAARFAFGMRLNYENPGLVFFAQESRRRVLWGLWAVEKLWAGGLQEFTLIPTNVVHLQLPCREEFFQDNVHTTTDSIDQEIGDDLDHKSSMGLLGFCLRLSSLRGDVLRHYKTYVNGSCLASEVVESIKNLEGRLQLFKSKLPTTAIFSAENLKLYLATPWLPRYISLNNSWHQSNCDVYRTLLPGYREAVPTFLIEQIDPEFVAYVQKQCYTHVKSQVAIFSALLNIDMEVPVMDFDMAVCAYHCTRLLLYMSRSSMFPSDNTLQEKANLCLATIKKLFPASGLTADIRKDIELLLSQNSPMERQSSDSDLSEKQGGDSQVKQPHLAPTAQSHQMLGRHSLVRRAKFVDDSSVLASQANKTGNRQSSVISTTTMTIDNTERRGEVLESQLSKNTMQGLEATGSSDSQQFEGNTDFTQTLGEGWDWSAYQEPWDTYDLDFLLNPERYTQNPWGLGFDDPSQFGYQETTPNVFAWQQL